MITNQQRFERIDTLFNVGRPYFVELEQDFFGRKTYSVYTLKDNSEKIEELSKEANALVSDFVSHVEYPADFQQKTEVLGIITNRVEQLTNEKEITGEIKIYLTAGNLKFEFMAQGELVREFIFKEGEYLDSVINYLDREYVNHLIK